MADRGLRTPHAPGRDLRSARCGESRTAGAGGGTGKPTGGNTGRAPRADLTHAILAKLGIPVTCTDIFGVWGSSWLDGLELPQPYAGKMASLRKVCAVLAGEIALLEAVIAGLPRTTRVTRRSARCPASARCSAQ